MKKYSNNRTFRNILKIAAAKQITALTPSSLSTLADALDPNENLDCLFLALENVGSVYPFLKETNLSSEWAATRKFLLATHDTTDALIKNRNLYSYNLPNLDLDQKSRAKDKRTKALDRIFNRAPFWSVMGYQPVQKDAFRQYFILLSHLWLSRNIVRESWAEQLTQPSLRAALEVVRDLTKDPRSTEIFKLPQKSLSPESYLEQLKKFPDTSPVQYIAYFLEDVIDIHRNRTSTADDDLTPEPSETLTDTGPTTKAPPSHKEDPSSAVITTITSTRRTSSILRKFPKTQIRRWIARKNQLFPFTGRILSDHELQHLLQFFFSEQDPTDDVEDTEARAMLSILFWGPLSTDRLSQLHVTTEEPYRKFGHEDSYNPHTGILVLNSPWPAVKYIPGPDPASQLFPNQKWMPLPLPGQATSCINLYLSQVKKESGRLFDKNADQIKSTLSNLISSIYAETNLRVTSSSIYTTVIDRLSRMPYSDPTTTTLITGELLKNAETKVHYSAFQTADLLSRYLDCRSRLMEPFELPVTRENIPPGLTAKCLGTPKRPRTESIQSALTRLLYQLKQGSQDKDRIACFVSKHNAYVTYVTLLLKYALGFRSVSHPYIESNKYDPFSGFCAILDKDIENGNHSRPVWMPKVCRDQLKLFREYLDRLVSVDTPLHKAHNVIEKSGKASLFFLEVKNQKIRQVPVEPRTIEPILQSFGYHIPLNSQRHFFKSTLQESGCPPDAVELFLGHWDHGEEGYSASSGLDPHTYRDLIEHHLNRALMTLGFTAVPGPRRPGWNYHIPVAKIPLNPSVQHRKKRARAKHIQRQQDFAQKFQDILPETFRKKLKISHLDIIEKAHAQIPDLFDEPRRELVDVETINDFYYAIDKKNRKRRTVYTEQQVFIRLIKTLRPDIPLDDIPPPPLMIKPESSLVRANIGEQLNQYRQLVQHLIQQIEMLGNAQGNSRDEKSCPDAEHQTRLGLIYTCAILFGGILSEKWAESLPEGIHGRTFLLEGLMWVDLWSGESPPKAPHKRFRDQRNPERYRRWAPDPITQALIIQWRTWSNAQHDSPNALPLEETLKDYLSSADCLKAVRGSYLKRLIQLGTAAALIHIPPFMVAYATNQLPSANLPDERWLRVVFAKPCTVPVRESSQITKYSRKRFLLSDQKKLRLTLCQTIYPHGSEDKGSVSDAKVRIEDFIRTHDKACPIIQLLAQWSISLLSQRQDTDSPHRTSAELAMSTVRNYVTNIGNTLIDAFRWQNPLILDEDDLQTIYQDIKLTLQKKSRRNSNKAPDSSFDTKSHTFIDTFNLFHWYLEKTFNVSFIPAAPLIQSIRDDKRTIAQVSAQLILPREYRQLLETYNVNAPKRTRLESIACCILILAYRMGLRRSEILGLRVKDALLNPLEIRISKHKGRPTKTPCATRRLPEYLPIPEDEKEVLRQWISRRRDEPKVRPTSYLFTETRFSKDMLDDHQLIPEILKNLKIITNDPDTNLHHCRHSFYTQLMFQSAVSEKIPAIMTPAFVEQGCRPEDAYWEAVMGNTATGRNKIHALTMLAGHSGVDVGMNTYMHLSDWLLGYLLRHPGNAPALTGISVAKLFQVSTVRGHEILREQGFPFAKALHKLSKSAEKMGFFAVDHEVVDSPKKTTPHPQRIAVFEDFDTAFDRILLKPEHKKIIAESFSGDELRTHYNRIRATTHGSTGKKMMKLATDISSRLKNNVVDCRSYQSARDLLWLLEKAHISRDLISAKYHLPPIRSDRDGQIGNTQLKRWRGRVPDVKISMDTQRTKFKSGIVRIRLKAAVTIMISLLAQQ